MTLGRNGTDDQDELVEGLRPFLIKMVSQVSRPFGIVFGIAIPFFSFFSFLIIAGIVFGIAAIPTILVSLVFLPRDTKTKSIAGIAVFIISGSSTYQNTIFERYTNFYFLLIINSNF